ncbi:hypothetical protein [Kitasatospora viridis]|uniref:Lipoprotein n=1 Tax=Kitasatospora viridis TaxID=281105 RepID=A0A561UJI7_9ACTN|nr:hypothetical protein [Kitasatospora viridis]TWF99533.1 hypothetical protein FHX73_113380 [Kitasatospora viridis]
MDGVRRVLRRLGLAVAALLSVAAVVSVAGCGGPDGVHDAGPARPLHQRPSPVPLWPVADTVKSPSATATPSAPAEPIPGLVAPGDSIRGLDPATVLAKDPQVSAAELSALRGCTGCRVYQPQYPELTGDGQEELVTAVRDADQHSYLHVYRLREHRVVSLLALVVQPDFQADTVGQDLVVDEPSAPGGDTRTTYHWNPERAAFDRQTAASGPSGAANGCLPGMVVPSSPPPKGEPPGTGPAVSAAPVPVGPRPVPSPAPPQASPSGAAR